MLNFMFHSLWSTVNRWQSALKYCSRRDVEQLCDFSLGLFFTRSTEGPKQGRIWQMSFVAVNVFRASVWEWGSLSLPVSTSVPLRWITWIIEYERKLTRVVKKKKKEWKKENIALFVVVRQTAHLFVLNNRTRDDSVYALGAARDVLWRTVDLGMSDRSPSFVVNRVCLCSSTIALSCS